jgi:hypothetical protein
VPRRPTDNRKAGGRAPVSKQGAEPMDYAAALTGQNQELAELLRDADW